MGLEMVALGVIFAVRLFPETPSARLLHLNLVERPMAALSKLERHQLLFLLIVVVMLFAATEVIAVLGSADIALSIAWDMSVYFDAVAVAVLVAAARQIRIAVRVGRARLSARPALSLLRRSRRERRPRPQRSASAGANDDHPAMVLAIA